MSPKVRIVHVKRGMTAANVIKHLRVILEAQRQSLIDNTAQEWVEYYHNQVQQMIAAIGALDGGADIVTVLAQVKKFINGNYLSSIARLYEANRYGFKPDDNWQVIDGDLVRQT